MKWSYSYQDFQSIIAYNSIAFLIYISFHS
jgi:hypothetical protein